MFIAEWIVVLFLYWRRLLSPKINRTQGWAYLDTALGI